MASPRSLAASRVKFYSDGMRVKWHFVSAALGVLVVIAACDKPVDAGDPVAAVPADPWVAPQGVTQPAAEIYASCASCHMADGSGRSDGTVPRLAGQRAAVLEHKLHKLQTGAVTLPVMVPYARSLQSAEVTAVARYLASLPVASYPAGTTQGASMYSAHCAACHGAQGEGNDAMLAPRLCGQHAAYLARRMAEIAINRRADADPAMMAIVQSLDIAQLKDVAAWLELGHCDTQGGP